MNQPVTLPNPWPRKKSSRLKQTSLNLPYHLLSLPAKEHLQAFRPNLSTLRSNTSLILPHLLTRKNQPINGEMDVTSRWLPQFFHRISLLRRPASPCSLMGTPSRPQLPTIPMLRAPLRPQERPRRSSMQKLGLPLTGRDHSNPSSPR
jgi:hypothetical protein